MICNKFPDTGAYRAAVIVLNYNNSADTRECLESVARLSPKPFEVILVDNGSAETDWKDWVSEFAGLVVLALDQNFGYAGGNNRGMRRAFADGADGVLILNNDTTVEPGALGALIDEVRGSGFDEKTLLAPMVLYRENNDCLIDSCGTEMNWFAFRPHRGAFGCPESSWSERKRGRIYAGSALFMTRGLYETLGGFDESFFLIHEDADLCLRNIAAGGSNRLVPSARVYHKRSRVLGKDPYRSCYYSARNFLYLAFSRAPFLGKIACLAGLPIWTAKQWVRLSCGDELARRSAKGSLAGLKDFLLGKKGSLDG